jgi:hypothetical protein
MKMKSSLKSKLSFGIVLVLVISMGQSCYYDNREDIYQFVGEVCDPSVATYSEDINAIMASNCAVSGCHDAQTRQSGINLSDYAGTSSAVLNGSVIQRIELSVGAPGLMPPSGRMQQCDIDKIKTWTLQGALNN